MGTVGEQMWSQISGFLSTPGALLIFLGMLTIGIVVFFNTSLDQVLNIAGTFFGTIASAFTNTNGGNSKEKKKEEKKPFFSFGEKLPMKVKGGTPDMKQPMMPSLATAGPVVKQAPKPSASLSSELVVNPPKTQGATIWEYPPGLRSHRG